MSKLVSQGGFGCVYHPGIKCDGSQDNKKKYVSKLQINDYTAYNEVNIGKIITKIPNYNMFFLPILSYCSVNVATLDNNLVSKCNTLHGQDDLVLMKMKYLKNESFYDFIEGKNKHVIFSQLIDKYKYLLSSIQMLNNNDIVHYDLKDENILTNKKNKLPVIIDFGISLNMNNFTAGAVDDYFYVYAPEYYIWCFDIQLICFLTKKIEDDNELFKKSSLETIAHDYTYENKILAFFSEDFKKVYKQNCIDFGNNYVNKTKKEILKSLITKKNYSTWDNHSLSCLMLKSIFYLLDRKMISLNFFKKIIQLAVVNMHPNPYKRYTIEKTKEKLNIILKNIEETYVDIFTNINEINIKRNVIDVKIKSDNETIERITNGKESKKMLK